MKEALTYKGYNGSILYSNEDQLFYGKVNLQTDTVAYEGKTLDELETSFREAVDHYLELRKEIDKSN